MINLSIPTFGDRLKSSISVIKVDINNTRPADPYIDFLTFLYAMDLFDHISTNKIKN